MRSWHEGTSGVWVIGGIVAAVLLSLVLGGCGGAGGVPTATGQASGTAGSSATGDATGTVTNPATQEPIPGATVTIAGQSDVTGPDGRYLITDITPLGVYTATCTAPGYTMPGGPITVQINEGTNTLDDILLTANTGQGPPPGPPSF